MSYPLDNKLVIGVSARTLFQMNRENEIFEREGAESYRRYQVMHEEEILPPGPGFGLIKAFLGLNRSLERGQVEVIIMSHNCPDVSLRIFRSIEHYGLDISRAVLVNGASLAPYLEAFQTDLFLSSCEEDVQCAVDGGIAAGVILSPEDCAVLPGRIFPFKEMEQIRIAFDGDAVLFSDEAELIFRQDGLEAFEENERKYVNTPLNPGPFARFLAKLSDLRKECPEIREKIRTALVTSRCAPAHERVIRTLRCWNVEIDEAFFLGGVSKREVLKAFGAHIFFDDQMVHLSSAASVVPVARVPYRSKKRRDSDTDEIRSYRAGEISGTA